MLILAIDDEPKMLRLLHKAIGEAAPDAQILDFSLGSAALTAISREKLRPSVIFTDIRMPKPDGLALAVELKKLVPDAKIVFVTGYDEYAVDAFRGEYMEQYSWAEITKSHLYFGKLVNDRD